MPMMPTTVAGVGAAAGHPDTDTVIDLGPAHPTAHGGLQLRLRLDGDTIVTAEPIVGFMHRGVEKLFEARDYRQAMMLANRHDWLSATSSELGIALALERLLGIEVPARATWIRMVLAEINRAAAHAAFAAGIAYDLGLPGPAARAHGLREALLDLTEACTGGRMHVMFTRVGGVKEDLPAGWRESVARACDGLTPTADTLRDELAGSPEAAERLGGAGHLDPALIGPYGITGPVAWASGDGADLRRDAPYADYAELEVRVPTRTAGDALARLEVLCDAIVSTLELVRVCVDRLGDLPRGPVNVRLPKNLKAPEATTYAAVEGPFGVSGYYLVSKGDKTPWRLKLRTPSFNHAAALPAMLAGRPVTELGATLRTLLIVSGDLDK